MVKVLLAGFYSTIQDLGRMEYQQLGVPISGAMDQEAANMANAILGNDANCAVIEMTMLGAKLEFTCNSTIAFVGAELSVKLNDVEVRSLSAINIHKGDVLSFGKFKIGFRVYLAVSGGFQTEVVLKSRSMYKGLTPTSQLIKGDMLKIIPNTHNSSKYSAVKFNRSLENQTITVYKGPEFENMSVTQKKLLFSQEFTISKENNRMAYQLDELVSNDLSEIITSLVIPGTIQLTPSGKLIVLMRDCQTTGGYPRVLQLSEASINLLAQKMVGDKIKLVKKKYQV